MLPPLLFWTRGVRNIFQISFLLQIKTILCKRLLLPYHLFSILLLILYLSFFPPLPWLLFPPPIPPPLSLRKKRLMSLV
jgi:hypothetical protein